MNDIQLVVLGAPLLREVASLARSIDEETLTPGNEGSFFAAVERQVDPRAAVFADLGRVLGTFARRAGAKVLVLRPTEFNKADVPATPTGYPEPGRQRSHRVDVLRAVVLALAGWYPYGFTSQQSGAIHNDVIFAPDATGVTNHSGSHTQDLGMHTEDASFNLARDHDLSPDFVSLHYLRNDEGLPTVVAIPDYSELCETTVAHLWRPKFINHTAPLQGGTRNETLRRVSVLYGDEASPSLRLNTGGFDETEHDAEDLAAVRELREHLAGRATSLPSLPGDIALIDNRAVAHSRPASSQRAPRFDGSDRWQRRVVVASDARRIRPAEIAPHVVEPGLLFDLRGRRNTGAP